jgi:hypothetical protein
MPQQRGIPRKADPSNWQGGDPGDQDLADLMTRPDQQRLGDWAQLKGAFTPAVTADDPDTSDVRDDDEGADQ